MKNSYICPMFLKGVRTWVLLAMVALLAACNGFNKVVKNPDPEFRYSKAIEYYNARKYDFARTLFEDLIPVYRGTSKGESVAYYRAMCFYKMKDYAYGGVFLKNFVKTFPKSDLAEECSYLSAICTYEQSPKYSLDQTETHNAINDFQLFLNRYPESNKRDTVTTLMIQCREKLEQKSFEISKLYYHTEKYKSAVVAFENTLKDFPNTRYEEDILLMMVESNYKLASNSVEDKMKERLEATVKAYQRYIDKYSQSKRAKSAETYYKLTIQQLDKLNKQLSAL